MFYLHRFSTMPGPCSSYSRLLTHIWWNVPRLARMLPPIQPANLRSATLPGAWSRTRRLGNCARSSASRRCVTPGISEAPPDTTTLLTRVGLRSVSTPARQALMRPGIVVCGVGIGPVYDGSFCL